MGEKKRKKGNKKGQDVKVYKRRRFEQDLCAVQGVDLRCLLGLFPKCIFINLTCCLSKVNYI